MIQVQAGIERETLISFPHSQSLTELMFCFKVWLPNRVTRSLVCFHCFQAALEHLWASITEEFHPGLLCLRNTLSGIVSSQALCVATQIFCRYSSIVHGLLGGVGGYLILTFLVSLQSKSLVFPFETVPVVWSVAHFLWMGTMLYCATNLFHKGLWSDVFEGRSWAT